MSCNMFLFLFLLSCVCSVLSMQFSQNGQKFRFLSESEKLKLIRRYLKTINKPAEKTIYSRDGDLIDCVAYDQQPAFDHPLLQEYKSLSRDHPEMAKQSSNSNDNSEEIIQVWHTSGESCPKHTIPIRRITEEDVLRASSVETFGVKKVSKFGVSERASGYVKGNFSGVYAVINIWVPFIDKEQDVSSSRVLIKAISSMYGSGTKLNSIEVGYKVVHGDPNPRLFVYWRNNLPVFQLNDTDQEIGCYDLSCSGFIQNSSKIALGGAFIPVSNIDKQQQEFNITIKKVVGGDWWLTVQGERVGYWPSHIVPLLDESRDCSVEYGGEVLSPVELNRSMPMPHTKTEMGSGSFPIINDGDDGGNYKKVAFIRNITLSFYNISETQVTQPQPQPQEHHLSLDNQDCYDAQIGVSDNWGVHLFYGGPGGAAPNNACTTYQY